MRAATCVRATLAALLALGTPAGALEVVKKSDSQIKAQVEAALEADETHASSTREKAEEESEEESPKV